MWDQTYDTKDYVYGKQANDFLVRRFGNIPGSKVLCLAEGEGRNAVFLASQGYRVTAVDISAVGLEKGRRLAEEHDVRVEFIHADLDNFDLGSQQWDGIVSIFCHLPPHIRRRLYPRVVAALKPGGVLLLEGYTRAQLGNGTGGPPSAEMMLGAELLQRELAGLSFNYLEELEREVIEGCKHTGIGAVVQAIAIKP